MRAVLEKLYGQALLTGEEAKGLMYSIAAGEVNEAQLASLMTVYRMRHISAVELKGFREGLLELALDPKISTDEAIDLCGTGGDGKNTFNISTLTSFIVAAVGGRVVKHGNYGVSSVSGSSTVLESLGVKFTTSSDQLNRSLETTGVCFLHAPLFHPALKNVSKVRKDLGVKTFFNMLGPLVNPARPRYRVTGLFDLKLLRTYQYLLQTTAEEFTLVHTLDGYDEVSLTADTKVVTRRGEMTLTPQLFVEDVLTSVQLSGGSTPERSAKLFYQILSGKGSSAQSAVVCANAALALTTIGIAESAEAGYHLAQETLTSGKALKVFNSFVQINS